MAQKSKAKKKAQTVQERRQRRYDIERLKKMQAEEIGADEEILEEDLSEEAETEEELSPAALALKEQIEALEKGDDVHYSQPSVSPMPVPAGPTSFEEMDAADAAQEKAHEVHRLSWRAQDLVYNILNNPVMEAKQKAKAIKDVGSGFEKRISAIMDEAPESVHKDLDVLSVESILAHDKRNTNFVEQMVDKARIALTPDSNTPYSLADKAHTRAALVWAAKEMATGGDGAVLAKQAMPEIRAAAKKFGIEMTMKKDRNAIVIEKDQSGAWRWIGWVSNNFQDTDGDIIAEVAHKEYVDFLDENPAMMPSFITWHTPGTHRESLPDFAAYENGFLIMSGQLTEKEAECLLKASRETDLGMSHGTLVFSRDLKDPRVITKYRMYEVSDLPLENAANPFTALETLSKEADMDKVKYLATLMGPGSEERAEALVKSQTGMAQKELTAAGIASKEAQPAPAAPQTPTPATDVVPDHVMKEIMEKLDIPGLNEFVVKANEAIEKVPLLEAALKELAANSDEALAAKISPPGQTLAWSQKDKRPSQSENNLVEGEDALLKNKPETGWLSAETGTKPVPTPMGQ